MTPKKNHTEEPERIPVASAIVVGPVARGAAIGLLAFGTAPLIVAWIRLLTLPVFDDKQWVHLTILGIFGFVALETVSLIVLRGFKMVDLSDTILKWLGAAALTDVGGLVWYIVKTMS